MPRYFKYTEEFLAKVKLYYTTNKENSVKIMAAHFGVSEYTISHSIDLIYKR